VSRLTSQNRCGVLTRAQSDERKKRETERDGEGQAPVLSSVFHVCGAKVIFMETPIDPHISDASMTNREKGRNQVMKMGGFVEQQLHKAITA